MKNYILLLLLATFGMQAQTLQNPTFGNVTLKNNVTSLTATKVNVQDANGVINTIPKSDLVNVVEVNDVPSLPLIGEAGKIYVVKDLNKIYRWNSTFYQELAINLVTSVSGKVGVVTLAKSDVGLANVDNTTDLLKPISTATQTALNLKENAFSKNTAFNKNFGTTAGTVVEGGTLGSNAYTSTAYLPLSGGDLSGPLAINSAFIRYRSSGIDVAIIANSKNIDGGSSTDFNTYVYSNDPYNIWTNGVKRVIVGGDGNTTFSGTVTATSFNGSAALTGTPTAPTAAAGTNTTQIATTAFVQANSRPYKVYTALITQTGTSAPVATVLENTLGTTITWSRISTGTYGFTLGTGLWLASKTAHLFNIGITSAGYANSSINIVNGNILSVLSTYLSAVSTDGVMANCTIEIRVYN